jgi:hypothetical protein
VLWPTHFWKRKGKRLRSRVWKETSRTVCLAMHMWKRCVVGSTARGEKSYAKKKCFLRNLNGEPKRSLKVLPQRCHVAPTSSRRPIHCRVRHRLLVVQSGSHRNHGRQGLRHHRREPRLCTFKSTWESGRSSDVAFPTTATTVQAGTPSGVELRWELSAGPDATGRRGSRDHTQQPTRTTKENEIQRSRYRVTRIWPGNAVTSSRQDPQKSATSKFEMAARANRQLRAIEVINAMTSAESPPIPTTSNGPYQVAKLTLYWSNIAADMSHTKYAKTKDHKTMRTSLGELSCLRDLTCTLCELGVLGMMRL